ncbi:MAG: helix-turn-helix domain-containing protein [Candidatus Cloacimonadaceae bacterium]|nr:helix-turn-helix domain-containing protein [Candidatus Cloacimonadaceae bacterium]
MEDLGKYLKDLREAHGTTYKKVWEDIRISELQVKNIEANDLFAIGAYGFTKALIFNYARYLEADIDRVMQEFAVLMPDTLKGRFKPSDPVKEKKIMLSTNFLWTLGIVIFVLILGSILYSAYQNGYLRAPNLFSEKEVKQKSEKVVESVKEDSLRQRMLILTETMHNGDAAPKKVQQDKKRAKKNSDDTDYLGDLMGESPINPKID